MTTVLIDDHLLRDVLSGERPAHLGGLATALVTTGLLLFRLSAAFAQPEVAGRLSAPVAALPAEQRERFVSRLLELPPEITVVGLPRLARPMAVLQERHRREARPLSVAMVEILAAAHELGAAIAVSHLDVGPNLKASAEHDGIPFHVL